MARPNPRLPARAALAAISLIAALIVLTGCGSPDSATSTQPAIGVTGTTAKQAGSLPDLAYPALATKNTTRVASADPVITAAAVARAVYPGGATNPKPQAIALADAGDWRAALAGAVLMAPPVRAPLLFTKGGEVPSVTRTALDALAPTGVATTDRPQAFRLGIAGSPAGLRSQAVAGNDAATLAANVDALRTQLAGRPSPSVVIVSADDPAFAMPAAAWAAKSGDPVLFVTHAGVPDATRQAITLHGRPRIYLLGPTKVITQATERQLEQFGGVTRIDAPTPAASAVRFARFSDGAFGWGIVDPGHGLVVASPARPADAGAAAPLSASGMYGPLLVSDAGGGLPKALSDYLLDIRSGYSSDPVRGVYNRAWIVGDSAAVSVTTQATIDGLLEIAPVSNKPLLSP